MEAEANAQVADAREYAQAITWEETIELAHRAVLDSGGLNRLVRQARFWRTRWKASRETAHTTDVLAEAVTARRAKLLDMAVRRCNWGESLRFRWLLEESVPVCGNYRPC
jgi:hypothetical protein